jgi:predicted peroxiredoxin
MPRTLKNALPLCQLSLMVQKTPRSEDMKRIIVIGAVVIGIAALGAPILRAQSQARDGVFIHLSHGTDDPHRVVMALQMAQTMSEDKDVLVYFDIKGIEVVTKDAVDIQFKDFASSKTQLSLLLSRKVTLMACPGCLKAAGKTPADLAPGIQVADKKTFFSFTKGHILSLDY